MAQWPLQVAGIFQGEVCSSQLDQIIWQALGYERKREKHESALLIPTHSTAHKKP